MSAYPADSLVAIERSCAAIVILLLVNTDRFTNDAVVVVPLLVVSTHEEPCPELRFTPEAIPVIVKVRVGSTLAWICTDSIVPMVVLLVSSTTLLVSCVWTVTFQLSAEVVVALAPLWELLTLFVGLIRRGDWVVQELSEVLASAQPMRKVSCVPPAIELEVVQVMLGAEMVQVQVVALLVEIFAAAFPDVRPLNEKVLAEGEAVLAPDPGNEMIIFPPEGMLVWVVNWILCMAVIGTMTGSPAWWALEILLVK